MVFCLDSALYSKYEERQDGFNKRHASTIESVKQKYALEFKQGYMRLGKLLIPLDSNYSRLAPLQCNAFLSQLILIIEDLYTDIVQLKAPFKMVHQRPFTYIISRTQLESPRPRLYPLEFPEAPGHESSAERMRKLYRRFLVGLAMLNFNVVRLASFYGITPVRPEELAQPLRIMERIFNDCRQPTVLMNEPTETSGEFNEILKYTIAQWNQQTGSNLPTNQCVLSYKEL